MTQIVNPVGSTTPASPPVDPANATAGSAAQPQGHDTADFRLVIEDDQAAGCFVYKTVDWRTGDVVSQIPREAILRLREEPAYLAGDVIKTKV